MVDYDDLPQNQKDEVLVSALNFIRTLTEIYGPEKGMAVWDKLSEAFGDGIRGAAFFAMITGDLMGDVILSKAENGGAVPVIKCIRSYTGLGLKEAKDLYDYAKDRGSVKIKVDTKVRRDFVKDLNKLGAMAR